MTDREGKAAKGGERQEESCLQGKEAAALQRDTKEHRQKEIRQLSGKSWPTRLNAPLYFSFTLSISFAVLSTALASWPLGVPRAPLRKLSCTAKGSARSCDWEAKPLGGKWGCYSMICAEGQR